MNDRFKFRVWNKLTHSFTTGGAIKFGGLCFIDEEDLGIKLGEHQELYVIEQCTGLKDNCGNLIYEGDIVEDMWGDALFVKWRDSEARFAAEDDNVAYDLEDVVDGCEIIGNIHEQAEQKDVKCEK